MATAPSTEEFLRLIGDPQKAADEMDQVRQSARVLSSDHPRLIDQYPEQWVAVHDGNVIATAETLDAVLASVDSIDPQSRSHVVVRFIDRHQQTLIL